MAKSQCEKWGQENEKWGQENEKWGQENEKWGQEKIPDKIPATQSSRERSFHGDSPNVATLSASRTDGSRRLRQAEGGFRFLNI